jgi:hypothetical protein
MQSELQMHKPEYAVFIAMVDCHYGLNASSEVLALHFRNLI